MKIEDIRKLFEEDESLKYALATNLAKYGRPQSKKSDKPAKLTKGLEKGREKYVKDLKKSMDEQSVFDNISIKDLALEIANDIKPWLADDVNPSQPDLQMTIQAILGQLQYKGLNEDEGTLNKIADMLDRKFPDLSFDVNTMADRIDVRGSQQDLYNFGNKLHGEKIFDYEVFHTDDDDRGEIVRIIKSDKLREDQKKPDRCLRIARRKIPQSSAYRSGLIVKCRKGMIWKSEK